MDDDDAFLHFKRKLTLADITSLFSWCLRNIYLQRCHDQILEVYSIQITDKPTRQNPICCTVFSEVTLRKTRRKKHTTIEECACAKACNIETKLLMDS